MKKTVLVNISYYVEIDESDAELSLDIQNKLCESRTLESDGEQVTLQWNQLSFQVLDPKNMNCGRCAKCGCWTTDREKQDSMYGLDNGAVHNGTLLCDECLPSEHRWAF